MVLVLIRNNATGEVREHEDKYLTEPDDAYPWEEGNYSCDCNRALFFARAKGEEDPDDRPCGDIAYSVKLPWDRDFD